MVETRAPPRQARRDLEVVLGRGLCVRGGRAWAVVFACSRPNTARSDPIPSRGEGLGALPGGARLPRAGAGGHRGRRRGGLGWGAGGQRGRLRAAAAAGADLSGPRAGTRTPSTARADDASVPAAQVRPSTPAHLPRRSEGPDGQRPGSARGHAARGGVGPRARSGVLTPALAPSERRSRSESRGVWQARPPPTHDHPAAQAW